MRQTDAAVLLWVGRGGRVAGIVNVSGDRQNERLGARLGCREREQHTSGFVVLSSSQARSSTFGRGPRAYPRDTDRKKANEKCCYRAREC